jgi:hypothetical protein
MLMVGAEQADEPVPLVLGHRMCSGEGAFWCVDCCDGTAEHAEHRVERGDSDWQSLLPTPQATISWMAGSDGQPSARQARAIAAWLAVAAFRSARRTPSRTRMSPVAPYRLARARAALDAHAMSKM